MYIKPIKPLNRPPLIWALLCLFYLLFIVIFSALYPYTLDEYAGTALSGNFIDAIGLYAKSFLHHSPKIGALFSVIILHFGKWLFVVLNPFVQLAVTLGIFYFVFLRVPDFKTLRDFPPAVLIALLSLIAVPLPDNTLFWIGGALNYSWTMLIFLFFLCALRALDSGKDFISSRPLVIFAVFLPALCLGMSNENNAPMAAVIFTLFCIWRKYKNAKPPAWFYFAFTGVIAGVLLLFIAPGSYKRLAMFLFAEFRQLSLPQKAFMHLSIMHDALKANFFLPLISLILILIAFREKFKTAIKNKDFILSVFCFAVSFVLAAVLFMAPLGSTRTFYSAAVFAFASFMLIIKFFEESYKIKIFKYLSALLFIAFLAFMPFFAPPYFDLYKQERQRMREIKNPQGPVVMFNSVTIRRGPTQNLTIHYYDSVVQYKFIQRLYSIPAELIIKPKEGLGYLAPQI